MTTTWEIFNTKSTIETGLITKVVYGCTVQVENDIERKIGELEITRSTASPEFIAYDEVTEQVIVGWIKTCLGQEQVATIENELQNKLTARVATREAEVEKNGLPWIY